MLGHGGNLMSLQVVRALDDLGLTWFEIDLFDPSSLRRIRDAVRTPIASCESLYGLRGFKPYFEQYSMDVAIIDVSWNGIWQGHKIATMAQHFGLVFLKIISIAHKNIGQIGHFLSIKHRIILFLLVFLN
jgi:L-alanine-DL-glutamate epimerase-like enolase superfamily enzyme